MARDEGPREFATGWPVLAGAILGIAIGVAAIPGPAIGVFLRDMQAEFGWSRAQIAAGPAILVGVLGLMSPLLGWIADRARPALICGIGLAILSVSLLAFSRLGPDLRVYYAACAGMAVAASGAGTLPYARAISGAFVRHRGVALGLATVGTGLAGMLLPALLAPFAAAAGWRAGFVLLAAIVAILTPAVVWLLSRSAHPVAQPTRTDASIGFALRDPAFWLLVACFALIPLGVGGLQFHFLAYLGDAGLAPAAAGRLAGMAGLFLIVGRVGTGWLVDRFFAPWVAAGAMAISALCIALLLGFGVPVATLGAIAIGLANGAEIDLIGFLTARYFGLRAYGRIYGLLYAVYIVGVSLSVALYGRIYDAAGRYDPAFAMAVAALLASTLLFLVLGTLERRRG
jgi:predicted MFS family arabinose efflux permease